MPERDENGQWKGYPKKRKAYAEWLSTPDSERQPSTKKAMAEKLDVHKTTLYKWEGQEEFQNMLRDNCLREMQEHRREVYDALAKEAKDGSIRHIKEFLRLVGDNIDRVDITSDGESIKESRKASNEDLAEELAEKLVDQPMFDMLGYEKEDVVRLLLNSLDEPGGQLEDGEVDSMDAILEENDIDTSG